MAGSRATLVVCFTLLLAAHAAAGTIGRIKANYHDGDVVEACGIVTAVFPDYIYIEDEDRSAGIRVRGFAGWKDILYCFDSNGSTTGLRVVTGGDGEKELIYLPGTLVAAIWVGAPAPLTLQNRALGGGDFCLCPATGKGQKGVCQGTGLNTIGLLVRTCGRVTEVNSVERWFYVDDGSCRCACGGHKGVRVDYSAGDTGDPVLGEFRTVTGICTVLVINGHMHAVVKL